MTVYWLGDEMVFPPPEDAEPDGLLAVGGDLSARRLLLAYQCGIFPWYSEGQPILWWSPDPRFIIDLKEFHISRSLRQTLKKGIFKVTFDRAFASVVHACGTVPRRGQRGTWITSEMERAYVHLHELGFTHSAESWLDGELAGGVYGVSLGRCFFAESMFFYKSDASKVALATLVEKLRAWDFHLIDAQLANPFLDSLGGKEMPRRLFLQRLRSALRFPTRRGKWNI